MIFLAGYFCQVVQSSQIPAHCHQNDVTWKLTSFERVGSGNRHEFLPYQITRYNVCNGTSRRLASGTSARSCVRTLFNDTLRRVFEANFRGKTGRFQQPRQRSFGRPRHSARLTKPPKQYSAPIDRVRRKRQRLPSSLLIENVPASAAACARAFSCRDISDQG